MASFAIPLVLGSFAAFGAAFGGGVDGATGNFLEEVSDSEDNSQPASPLDSESEDEEPKKTTPSPESEEPTSPEPQESTPPPEPVETVGGAIGRPTWAPISQSSPISLSTPGATGSSAIFAKITGSYKKGPADFQSELKDIDDQLRVLRAREFQIKESETEKTNALTTSRETYYTDLTKITKNEKLIQFYDKKINDLLKPESSPNTGKYTEIVAKIFPKNKDGKPTFPRDGKQNELDFEKWRDSAFTKFSEDSMNDDPVGIKPQDGETPQMWWGRISKLSASPTEKSGKDDVETKLGKLIGDKNNALRDLELAKDSDSKSDYDEKVQDLKDLKSKLKDVQKQIKDLRDKRELILVDLSNYELPKGLFADKAVPQKSILPIGEERDQIIRSIKDVEQQIKEKQTDINDYIDQNLDDNGKLRANTTNEYEKKTTDMKTLKTKRNDLILKLEGRTPQQKELLRDNELEKLIKDLLASKLVDKNGVKTVLINSSFPKVFAMYRELSTADMQTIHEKIDRYYNFFTKAKTVGFTAFNGQDVSNAFSFLFLYTTDKYNIPQDLKTKIKDFLKTNRKLILESLTRLEYANKGIKTPTEETRDIVEQALMSGQAPFAKSLQSAVKSFDPSKYFGQTDKAKLERVIKDFRERIFNKTQVVYLKYGLWGKEAVSLIESIQGLYDEYKNLFLSANYNLTNYFYKWLQNTPEKPNIREEIILSLHQISELAKIIVTFIDDLDPSNANIIDLLNDISEPQPEFFIGGAKAKSSLELQSKLNSIRHILNTTSPKLVLKYEKLYKKQIKIFFEKMSTSHEELRELTATGNNSSNIAVKRKAEEIVRAVDAIKTIVDVYRKRTDKDSIEFIKKYNRDLSETYSEFRNEAIDAARSAEQGIIEYNEKDAKENDKFLKRVGILLLNVIEGTVIVSAISVYGLLSAIKDFYQFTASKSYDYVSTRTTRSPVANPQAEVVPEQVGNTSPVISEDPAEVLKNKLEIELLDLEDKNSKFEKELNDLRETINTMKKDGSPDNKQLALVTKTNIIKYNNEIIVPLINRVNKMVGEISPELKANESVAEELVKVVNILSILTLKTTGTLQELIRTGSDIYNTARGAENPQIQQSREPSEYSKLLSNPNEYIKKYASQHNIALLTDEVVRPELAGSSYNLNVFPNFNNWTVLKTIGDGNCLTHAFLQSCSSEYRKLPANIKEGLGIHFRKMFSKYSPLSKNKDLYNRNNATEWLTDIEITDYSKLFNVITIIFDQPNSNLTASFGNFRPGNVAPETPVIFIHASGAHYSSVQTPEKSTVKKFEDASSIPDFVELLSNLSNGGNHRTRRHWVRSKPSRFTRHKIY